MLEFSSKAVESSVEISLQLSMFLRAFSANLVEMPTPGLIQNIITLGVFSSAKKTAQILWCTSKTRTVRSSRDNCWSPRFGDVAKSMHSLAEA